MGWTLGTPVPVHDPTPRGVTGPDGRRDREGVPSEHDPRRGRSKCVDDRGRKEDVRVSPERVRPNETVGHLRVVDNRLKRTVNTIRTKRNP